MENPYYVLSDDRRIETTLSIQNIKAVVLVCLYYEEQVVEYQEYLKKIPGFIDIYIISAKDEILMQFKENRFRTIKKENRGRDISALLVVARSIIFQYEYVCFIHDKKEKSMENKSYTDFWKKNLWDNMLGSRTYIYNLLELFESEEKLGMLAPLPPHKEDKGIWLQGAWGNDYENTKQLAEELDLDVPILKEQPPFAFSTVFWARTKTLKKLYAKQWDYSDFPDEPMKNDGEINHAIERILQYVVEDVGYETKIAISSSFAALFFQQMHDELQYLWENLEQSFRIRTYSALELYTDRLEKLKRFVKGHNKFFLYGAGERGKDCLAMCKVLDIMPQKVLVTNLRDNQKNIDGVPVFSIEDFMLDNEDGIIITVGKAYQAEIIQELEKRGMKEYMIF